MARSRDSGDIVYYGKLVISSLRHNTKHKRGEIVEHYWEITERDGTVTKIPPDAVEVVKRRMASREPINTRNRSIPIAEIKSFTVSEKVFSEVPLIEDAARAFKSPLINEDGSIQARWVKKLVPQSKWDKFYAPSGYKRLDEESGMIWVAFRIPTHLIDVSATPYCSEDEVRKLEQV